VSITKVSGLNIYLVFIFVKIIQFGPYFRYLFNLVIIYVKSYSIESFWQTVLKLLTAQWHGVTVWVTCQILEYMMAHIGTIKKKLEKKVW